MGLSCYYSWNAVSEQAIGYQVLWTGVALVAKSSLQEIAKNAHSLLYFGYPLLKTKDGLHE
ncbi:hypothetical protein DP116_21180 [Brasilonema bromeliae SPC951]|uniref:Uncharacterized protein n=1 Tax=Brasilonema bromeliae SPC951 TaxID=385972 RepID=A0ABX1PBI1_9CYAN|nr:hypothetical protein [Brasilonema bromeliae SPC951]